MEGRCAVETWADFGFSAASCKPKVAFDFGTDVFICTGSDEVYLFNAEERRLTAVLQFPGLVSDLVESHDKQLLYVSCTSGVYCVSLQFLQSRFPSSQTSSSPTELKIPPEFLAVREEGVVSLLLVGSVLLVLSQRDTSWLWSLYKTTKQTPTGSYEMLRSFSLPQVGAHGDSELKARVGRRPVLICVYCGEATPPSSSSTTATQSNLSQYFHLEPVLFKLLFGIDAALIKSPVMLCGLPDGRLCFLPLHLPGSRLQVLHSLEQPVAFLGASVVMDTGPGHAQCLVAVGELGRAVVIKTDKSGTEGGCSTPSFTEGCVPGPVVCGCVDKHNVYYSTGSDLLVLDLSDGPHGRQGQERNEETSSESSAGLKSPTSLSVCRVVGLTKALCSTTGEVQLLGLSFRGQLQRITLPTDRENTKLPSRPSAEMGHAVKDLLSAIGDVCQRASALKTSIKSKNLILKHLNHVLNISILLKSSNGSKEHIPTEEKPIRCQAVTRWSRLLQEDSLNLSCVLNNSSPYILERGWTLSITVCPLSYSASAGGESSSTTFSFPFCNLHPGETLEVSLPLAAAGSASFPMTVHCSLVFSLAGLPGEEDLFRFTGLQSSCISLPLNTLTVDWLHALRVNCPTASHKHTLSHCNTFTTETIKALLSSHRTRCSGSRRGQGGEGFLKHDEELYSARIRVSSDLLRESQVLRNSDSNLNHCTDLLDWLLCEEHGGVKMGHQGDKMPLSSSTVCAQASNGDKIKLTVTEVKVEDDSLEKEESLSTLEVRVQSTSIAAVCGLHHAVLHRLQSMLQKAPHRSTSTRTFKTGSLGLTPLLQRAERLLQQIQQSRISEAFGVGVSTGQMTRSVLSVYQELRENPLLII